MFKFLVLDQGKPAASWTIRNAYLLGSDNSAMRADVVFEEGMIICRKREPGAAALVLQVPVEDCGEQTLQTCLLPERDEPYHLNLELARHRLMVLYSKLEDWAMFDANDDHPTVRRAELAKRLFIEALCQLGVDSARVEKLARDCLVASLDTSEELALQHADLLLGRRRSTGALPRHPIGVGVVPEVAHERLRAALAANFDFLRLPMAWKALAPEEDQYRWAALDNWIEWALRARVPVMAGPVMNFDAAALPNWLFIWEHDYDTLRDLTYEHVERVVSRYRNAVGTWVIASGLHLNCHFNLSFDQLMDLTRMSVMLVRKIQPAARILVEIRQPFGEYSATQARTIPPQMYADLLVQGQVPFDGFSLKFLMGQPQPGQSVRDLMQISGLLDSYAVFGKSLHFCFGAPSDVVSEMMLPARDVHAAIDANCGVWRKPWSQLVQGRWMESVMHVALSKPFVDSVAWTELIDHKDPELPLSGLVDEVMQPKSSFRRLVAWRRQLLSAPSPVAGNSAPSHLPAANPHRGNPNHGTPPPPRD